VIDETESIRRLSRYWRWDKATDNFEPWFEFGEANVKKYQWLEQSYRDFENCRRVALTNIEGRFRVSTVFLALDHGWGNSRPILFETLADGSGIQSDYMMRYATPAEAREGHARIVRLFEFMLKAPRISLKNLDQVLREI
jgi:hypothetical protein